MKIRFRRFTRRLCAAALRTLWLAGMVGILTFTTAVGEAEADRYDPKKAGNPIRVSAYILHPVGVLLDYGLMRPCFWLVQREPFSTIFGYEKAWHKDLPERD